jgi:integrase
VYYHNQILAERPIEELIARYHFVEKNDLNEKHVEAVLGASQAPVIKLINVLNIFYDLSKESLLDKSDNQVRKWKNTREASMQSFIACVGDMPIATLTRDDVIRFKNWWIDRLDIEGLSSNTANKQLVNVKTIISSVAEHYRLPVDFDHVFKKLLIKRDDAKKRPAFTTEFLITTLLNPSRLRTMNEQARGALYAFAETGASFSELTGLLPEDIILNAPIPHIVIRSRKGKGLKTKYRRRTIPLTGFALDTFRAFPNGFTNYSDRADSLSVAINKYLQENNMLPSDDHTPYSLRHSFQNRLLAVNAPDRVQADLMGHKFNRPIYGDGASLQQKLEWMQKIQLKPSHVNRNAE